MKRVRAKAFRVDLTARNLCRPPGRICGKDPGAGQKIFCRADQSLQSGLWYQQIAGAGRSRFAVLRPPQTKPLHRRMSPRPPEVRACEKMGTGSGRIPENMGIIKSRAVPVPIFSQAL